MDKGQVLSRGEVISIQVYLGLVVEMSAAEALMVPQSCLPVAMPHGRDSNG